MPDRSAAQPKPPTASASPVFRCWQSITVGWLSLNPAYAQKARGGRLLLGCKLLTAPDPERTFHRSASGYPRGSRALSDLPISALTLFSLFLSGGKHQGL